jgi:hypothetical protein
VTAPIATAGWTRNNPSSRLTCPSAPAVTAAFLQRLTCPRQRAFAPGHQARYPASYTQPPGGGAGHTSRAFLLPFGRRHSLPEHPFPPGDSAPLTVGLPRRHLRRGPGRGFHVPHA